MKSWVQYIKTLCDGNREPVYIVMHASVSLQAPSLQCALVRAGIHSVAVLAQLSIRGIIHTLMLSA